MWLRGGWLWVGVWCFVCSFAFWRCTERIIAPEEACLEGFICSDGGVVVQPPAVQPTPSLPNLGKACSKDVDCGTGLVCVKNADEAMRCHQDCSQNPLDCQKNTDGRTTCLRNESGQRFCFQPRAKEGARCGFGMHNDCDKRGAEPLYCDPVVWRCKKAAQTGRPSEACDLPRGKGCLLGLSCLSPKKDGVGTCEIPCRFDVEMRTCEAMGFSPCVLRRETGIAYCAGEVVEEGGYCSLSRKCKSWLSLFCDEATQTCKQAPRIGKKGEPCVPSAQGGGCIDGLFCLSGRCAATCKEEPSLCATGERCERDLRGVWSCLPAPKGGLCDANTTCDWEFVCDVQRKQCALRSRSDARLGETCSGYLRVSEGLACTALVDSFWGPYFETRWTQDCFDDPSICAKNTDARTTCYPIGHTAGGWFVPQRICLRLDAKEGEACGTKAQALCEDDDSQQPKLLCLRDVCTRPILQKQEGAPCVGPFLDILAFAYLDPTVVPALCDRDAAVPLVCDPKTKACIKAGIVGEGQLCLGATGNLCEKGFVCDMESSTMFLDSEGVCKRACDVRRPQCPQGSSCSRSGRFWPKIHTGVCYPK